MNERKLNSDQELKIARIKEEFHRRVEEVGERPKVNPEGVYVLDNGTCEPYDSIWKWYQEELKKVIEE